MTLLASMLAFAGTFASPAPTAAQEYVAEGNRGPGAAVNVSFLGANALGDFGTVVNHGFGLELGGGLPLAADGLLRLRGDLGFLVYGHERIDYCDFGCRVGSTVTTTNSMLFAGIGPELVFGTGNLQPYLHGSAGASWFVTSSSYSDGPSTTNYWDVSFAWRAGGGLRFRMGSPMSPIYLDLGVTHHDNQPVSYLTEGDIVDNPDGTITMYPNLSDADFLSFKLGLSIAIR
jgi:hypothetical protein